MDEHLRELLLAAIDLDEDERAAFLEEQCRDEPEMRALLESLRSSIDLGAGRPTAALPEQTVVPDVIGRYRIVDTLGRGGFGIVYLARQTEPIRRTVALKMILLGMDTRQVLARFEAERQLMAMMDHPHIAQVHDAGETDDGRPYFVMEYVPGISLTDYCDRNRLSIEERLALFVQVCAAIQHAHQKGVIHRDIKPSNVLVTSKSGDPTVKVIDFGVAKAVDRALVEQSAFTLQGQLIGTPEYMSPEQAEMRPDDIDTRTDIYSLGVLLYELLTGSLPFDPRTLRARGLAEIYRVIREVDPPSPSTRISTMGEQSSARASARRIDPRSLVRELRDDLDWITMKAMEKDRTRRYASAAEFAEDVRRHLRHEPVVACPPGNLYRAMKFVRRHRVGVAAAAAITLALLAGIAATTTQMLRAQALQVRAERRSYLAELAAASLALEVDQLATARRHLARAPTAYRGWEWRHLQSRLDASRRVLNGHASEVIAAAITPDGEVVTSLGADGELRWWSIGTGEVLAAWRPDGAAVRSMALDGDGRRLATGGADGTVRIWDARSRDPVGVGAALVGGGAEITSLAFSHDGGLVAAGDLDGRLHLWTLADAAAGPRTLEGHSALLSTIRFAPNDRALATTAYDGTCRLWDVETGRSSALVAPGAEDERADVATGLPPELTAAVAFSPDGTTVAVARHLAGTIELWDAEATRFIRAVRSGHDAPVGGVVFSPDGAMIASCSADHTIRLGGIDGNAPPSVLRGHVGAVHAATFTPDGANLVSASADGTLRVWDTALTDWGPVLAEHERTVHALAAGPADGDAMWSAGADRQVLAWGGAPPRVRARWRSDDPDDVPARVAADPRSTRVAIGTFKGRVILWALDGGQRDLGKHDGSVTAMAFSHDGNTLATAGADATVRLWPAEAPGAARSVSLERAAADIAFGRGTEHLLTVDGEDRVRTWRDDGAAGRSFVAPGRSLTTLAVDGAWRWLAASGADGVIVVWTLPAGDRRRELTGHDRGVLALAFEPAAGDPATRRAARLVSASADRSLRIWDVEDGEAVIALNGHAEPVFAVDFARDGTRLYSSSMDTTVRVWDTVPAWRRMSGR